MCSIFCLWFSWFHKSISHVIDCVIQYDRNIIHYSIGRDFVTDIKYWWPINFIEIVLWCVNGVSACHRISYKFRSKIDLFVIKEGWDQLFSLEYFMSIFMNWIFYVVFWVVVVWNSSTNSNGANAKGQDKRRRLNMRYWISKYQPQCRKLFK